MTDPQNPKGCGVTDAESKWHTAVTYTLSIECGRVQRGRSVRVAFFSEVHAVDPTSRYDM